MRSFVNMWVDRIFVMSLAVSSGIACAGDIQFTDITDQSGVDYFYDAPGNSLMSQGHFFGGIGAGDFDRNGSVDLFFPGSGTSTDRLYLNDGTGHFTDASAAWGLVDIHLGNGIGVADVDADGWLDVIMTSAGDPGGNPGAYRFYRNVEGTGFVNIAVELGLNDLAPLNPQQPTFVSPGDYDGDGDIDLFYGSWQPLNQGNKVMRNNGDGTFTNVSEELGMHGAFISSRGWSSTVVDMNHDLLPEVLWVGDFRRSHYFKNTGTGVFDDLAGQNGTNEDQNGMGGVVLDANVDGQLDWFVTSIFDDDDKSGHNGNALYIQYDEHEYLQLAGPYGVVDSGWAWTACAVDFDQDGREDLAVANGNARQEQYRDEVQSLFQNDPSGIFYNVATASGLALDCASTSCVSFDLENDGDFDLVFLCNEGNVTVYRNDTVDQGSWLQIDLGGDPKNGIPPYGLNTRIEANVGDKTFVRYMDGNSCYGACGPQTLHFGLGDAEVIDTLEVSWINGKVTVLKNVAVNQILFIDPDPSDCNHLEGDFNEDCVVNGIDLGTLLAAWGPCPEFPEDCPADINIDGVVNGADISFVLNNWTQ
jgi:hypothetical protein